jgi:hypothetical protein
MWLAARRWRAARKPATGPGTDVDYIAVLVGCVACIGAKFSRLDCENIVSRQWPPDPLQLELTDGLDLHGVPHCD